MNKGIFWTVGSCVGFMALVLGLFLNQWTTPRDLSAEEYKDLGVYFIEPSRNLTNLTLVDDTNSYFKFDDFKGKWNVLFFGFTFCPDICPLTMRQLKEIKKDLGDDSEKVRFFLVSVDPIRDTPEKLRVYLDNFDEDFIGLTGGIDQVYKFATQVNVPFTPVVESEDPFYAVDHTGSLVLIDPEGKYAGFFRAPHDSSKVLSALESLLNRNQ